MAASISVNAAPLDLLQQTLPRLLSNLSIARAQIAIDQIRATIDTRAVNQMTFLGASTAEASNLAPRSSTRPPDATQAIGMGENSTEANAPGDWSAAAIAIQQSHVLGHDGQPDGVPGNNHTPRATTDMATIVHAGFLREMDDFGPNRDSDSIDSSELISAVARQLDRTLRSQGVAFVQWATDPQPQLDATHETWCRGLDFEPIGCLDYLSCELKQDETENPDSNRNATLTSHARTKTEGSGLQFEPIRWNEPNAIDRFGNLVERTYEATLDCPDLSRYRSTNQTLEGYRSSSAFDPEHWFCVKDRSGSEVGCLILASHRDTQSSQPDPRDTVTELVYMGLVPSARGQGIGRQLVNHALQCTLLHRRMRIILAVDQANAPARSIYDEFGFCEMLSETVWVKRLGSANREESDAL